jgi:hypothetical protein
MKICSVLMTACLSLGCFAPAAQCDGILFTENCEAGLSSWIGQSEGPHNGMIVVDPMNPANHAITFSALSNSGDIFSLELPSYDLHIYWLNFDYLGFPKEGTPEGNTGGRIGITNGSPGSTILWLAGTITEEPYQEKLIDDGQWHSYSIPFVPEIIPGIAQKSFRVMVEDWSGLPPDLPEGVPGDAFFDNFQVGEQHVPTEDTTWGAIKEMFE